MNTQAKRYYQKLGKTEDELQALENRACALPNPPGKSERRPTLRGWVKEVCEVRWSDGQKTITPQQAFEWVKENKDYAAKDCKGIADVMGEAQGGLFLKLFQPWTKKREFIIPDPKIYIEWYQGDVPLAESYYGQEHFDHLCLSELRKEKTTFFDGRDVSEGKEVEQ